MTTPPTSALMSVVDVGPADPDLSPTTLVLNTNGVVPVSRRSPRP